MPDAAALVLAGGSGTRVGADGNKVYLSLAGRPLIAWSVDALRAAPEIARIVLVVRAHEHDLARSCVSADVELVTGGATRHESEHRGLQALAGDVRSGAVDVIAIHDGARPLVRPALVSAVVAGAREHGAALPGVPVEDVCEFDGDTADGETFADAGALDRLVRVQTPQAFRAGVLLAAYEQAERDGFAGSDTSACIERYTSVSVRCLPGDAGNIKVTYARDLALAERLLATGR